MVRLAACHPLSVRFTHPSVLIAVALVVAACPGDAADDTATRCGLSLSALAAAYGMVPPPAVPGLPAAQVRADPEADGARDAIVIDPAPLLRGEHPGGRVTLTAPSCRPRSELLPWVPTGPPPAPAARLIGDTEQLPHPLIGALVITGADSGADRDAAAWSRALRDLRVSAWQLAAPELEATRAAIADLCAGLEPGASAIVVTTGRGTLARGGGLVLGREAITWATLAGTIATACDHLGLVVWVADAAHTADIDLGVFGALPVVLWRASDDTAPDAARTRLGGGGALSEVLAAVVQERLPAACLTTTRPRPAELAALFAESGVRERLLATRWAENGAGTDPAGAPTLAAALAAQVPWVPVVRHRLPERADRCEGDVGCVNLAAGCELAACQALRCVDGMCVAQIIAGSPCDDSNSCTKDDLCDAAGVCRGELTSCDDGNPCTVEGCEPGIGCVALPVGAALACDDGDACTDGDACNAVGVCEGAARDCDDGDPCTIDSCLPDVGCVSQPAPLACDDGDPCTYSDACVQGLCAGTRLSCDDGNACTSDACDPAVGACASRPLLEGTPCDDDDACTVADRCLGGVCAGLGRACDDGLACTFDSCEAGVCAHAPVPGTCLAGVECVAVGQKPEHDPCVVCAATGVLAADPAAEGIACAPDDVSCSIDRCEAGICRHVLPPGTCGTATGGCVGVGDDVAPCLVCVATGIASPRPAGTACSSGAACMAGSCDEAGFCDEAPVGCCPALPIACDELQEGAGLSGTGRVDAWSCAPGEPLLGPERTWWFDAPCAGTVTFAAGGNEGARVVVGAPDLAGCADGTCLEAGAQVTRTVAVGDALTVTLEAVSGAAWRVGVTCACDEDAGASP